MNQNLSNLPGDGPSEFVDADAIAKRLAYKSSKTILRLARSRAIPSVRLGRKTVFHWEAVRAAILQRQINAGGSRRVPTANGLHRRHKINSTRR